VQTPLPNLQKSSVIIDTQVPLQHDSIVKLQLLTIDSVTIVLVQHSGLPNAKRLIQTIKEAKPNVVITEGMGPLLRIFAADTSIFSFRNTEEIKAFFKKIEKDSSVLKRYEEGKRKVGEFFAVTDVSVNTPDYKIFNDTIAAFTKANYLTSRIVADGYTKRSDQIVDTFLMVYESLLVNVHSSWFSDSSTVCNIYADSVQLIKMLNLFAEFNAIREDHMLRLIMREGGHRLYHVGALHGFGFKRLLPKANFISQYEPDADDLIAQSFLYFHLLHGQARADALFNFGQCILKKAHHKE
jgi:hypothetical protein